MIVFYKKDHLNSDLKFFIIFNSHQNGEGDEYSKKAFIILLTKKKLPLMSPKIINS